MERTLEVALDEIAGSNGYASSAPEERNYVVAQLTRLRDALKTEAQVHWMMIKTFGIDPLAILAKRYGKAAIGIVATATLQAMQEWLKKVATKAIEWFAS